MSLAPFATQFLSYFLMPIIARLYSPAMFGVFNLFGSINGPLTTFSSFSFHDAIVIPDDDNDACDLVLLGSFISIITSTVILISLLLIPSRLLVDLNFNLIQKYIFLIPISVFLHGINMSFVGWNQRKMNFSTIATSRIFNSINNKVYVIVAGILGFATSGNLIVGLIIGSLFMTIIQSKPFILFITNNDDYSFSIVRVIKCAKKYKKFPIFIMSSDMAYRLSSSLIIILLVYFFSENVAGNYGMAIAMTSIPTILIGSSIAEVFYAKVANEQKKVNLEKIYITIFTKLVRLSGLVFFILSVISQEIYIIVFGDAWIEAGKYTTFLSFQIFVAFITAPINNLIKIIDKQQYSLIFQFAILIFSVASIIAGGLLSSSTVSISLLSFSTGILTLLFALIVFKLVFISPIYILKILLKEIIYFIPFMIPVLVSKFLLDISNMSIILISMTIVFIYYIYLFKKDDDLMQIINQFLNKIYSN
tara:strand:+ start:3013 stop:4443 length:1431 start_codon:yes stop_codon:yes gene_type:complete